MSKQAKKRFPGQVPVLLGRRRAGSGAAVLRPLPGGRAGVKSVYPGIPKSHIIEVITNGVATDRLQQYAVGPLRRPQEQCRHGAGRQRRRHRGMFKAVQARGFADYLAESYGGDSYGLKQVCLFPTHYVGAWYLNPAGWGPVLLSLEMMQMNGQKVPHGNQHRPASRSLTASSVAPLQIGNRRRTTLGTKSHQMRPAFGGAGDTASEAGRRAMAAVNGQQPVRPGTERVL